MAVTHDAPFLEIPRLGKIPWLVHGFGTRRWKLADFRKSAPWSSFRLIIMDQVHSDTIHSIERHPRRKLRGDVLITALPGVFLVIKTADCLPVFIVDEKRKAVGAVHCGRQGTRQRVLEKTVKAFIRQFRSDPASVLIGMGPCIGPDCYEVGEDVRTEFDRAGVAAGLFKPHPQHAEKFLLDLRKANRLQLLYAGIKPEHIFSIDDCTHCDPRLLSYRRDRSTVRRMYAFVGIRV